jgi:hydrogenase 3 maturation protease
MELSDILRRRVAVVGIGSELRCDDGFGPYLTRSLNNFIKYLGCREDVMFLDAGNSPELYTDVIREFNPEVVLFVDAVDFSGDPGDVILADAESAIGSATMTTHYINLKVVLKLIGVTEAYILGVKPACRDYTIKLSEKVADAFRKLFFIILREVCVNCLNYLNREQIFITSVKFNRG